MTEINCENLRSPRTQADLQPANFSSFFPPAFTISAFLRSQDFFLSCEQQSEFLLSRHLVAQGLAVCRGATIRFADSVQAVVNLSCTSELNLWKHAVGIHGAVRAVRVAHQIHWITEYIIICCVTKGDQIQIRRRKLFFQCLCCLYCWVQPFLLCLPPLRLPHWSYRIPCQSEMLKCFLVVRQRRGEDGGRLGYGKTWHMEWENEETLWGESWPALGKADTRVYTMICSSHALSVGSTQEIWAGDFRSGAWGTKGGRAATCCPNLPSALLCAVEEGGPGEELRLQEASGVTAQPREGRDVSGQSHGPNQLIFGRVASPGRQKRLKVREGPKRWQCEKRNTPFLSLPMLFFKAVHDCEETALHRAPQRGHGKPPTHAGGKHSATLYAACCPGWPPLFRFIKC